MDTLKNTLIIASAIIILGGVPRANAQNQGAHPDNYHEITDQVKLDLETPADKQDQIVYERTVSRTDDGTYAVQIKDENDRLRMTGRYRDAELRIAEGSFTYYYPNGNIESRGEFVNGAKSGIWYRRNWDGSPKAERVYGPGWEEMAGQADSQ